MRLNNAQKAERIYSAFFGHLDDREFAAEKTQEIRDWLDSGLGNSMTLRECIDDWRSYDWQEIERQGAQRV